MPRRRQPDGRVLLVTGSTGSGKSTWVRQDYDRSAPLLVWDSKREWSHKWREVRAVGSLRELHAAIVADITSPGAFRIGYVGPVTREAFEIFCQLAWVWMRSRRGVTLIVEELADVTSPGKAPPAWGEILRKSRDEGANVYGLGQRPAESDKTIVGNAALIHTGFLAFADDRKYLARCLDVPLERVSELAQLDYIERDMRTRELRTGRVGFGNSRPRVRQVTLEKSKKPGKPGPI